MLFQKLSVYTGSAAPILSPASKGSISHQYSWNFNRGEYAGTYLIIQQKKCQKNAPDYTSLSLLIAMSPYLVADARHCPCWVFVVPTHTSSGFLHSDAHFAGRFSRGNDVRSARKFHTNRVVSPMISGVEFGSTLGSAWKTPTYWLATSWDAVIKLSTNLHLIPGEVLEKHSTNSSTSDVFTCSPSRVR